MQYRPRAAQTKPSATRSLKVFGLTPSAAITDDIFDTQPLPRPIRAVNWTAEANVHGGVLVTNSLRDANQFVGVQVMAVRDEVRRVTHIAAIEADGLFHYVFSNGSIANRNLIAAGPVVRAHIALRKYDGQPILCYVMQDAGASKLYLNRQEVAAGPRLDFPFFVIQQPTIGLPATKAPSTALLTYKDRDAGRIFFAKVDAGTLTVGPMQELPFADAIGGADADFNDTECLVRAQCLIGGKLRTHLSSSADLNGFSAAVPLDLSSVPHEKELPANAPVTADNTDHFHVPVAVSQDGDTILLDALPDDDLVVAAIEAPSGSVHSIARFPSMSGLHAGFREGFGDGDLDGSGMIATLAVEGRLLVANSQSGGYSYPAEATLNHEMQTVYGFRATECYTRGVTPNAVSMDYAFVESDDAGRPVSSELWVDTWDMPLPEPIVRHSFANGVLKLNIEKCAWFFHGQTAFEIDPANTFITKVTMTGFREIELEFDDPSQVPGATVSFETKNAFYHYRGIVKVWLRLGSGPLHGSGIGATKPPSA